MSAQAELLNALAEWRRLAEAEGKAIRGGNWCFVAECQQAISRLRPIIDRLTGQAGNPPVTAPAKDAAPDPATRSLALELIELERRNLSWLEQRRQDLSAHFAQLSRSGRNLRGIQRSYAPPPPPAWSFYS